MDKPIHLAKASIGPVSLRGGAVLLVLFLTGLLVLCAGLAGAADRVGAIQVTIYPDDAVTSGAQWGLANSTGPTALPSVWYASGDTADNVPVGVHGVIFKEVAGWKQPRPVPVHVLLGQTVATSGTYVQIQPLASGSLCVTLEPADAVTAGAKWWVSSRPGATCPTALHDSGETVSLPAGSVTVGFAPAEGWQPPEPQVVEIVADQTACATGTYTVATPIATGSLQVTIVPQEAVTAGAQWRRAGTPTWYASGETETGLPVGPCTVEFGRLEGWLRPGEQQVTILADQTVQCQGEYVVGTTRPGAPIDVAASDGTFADHVEVTWAATTTATAYFQVYRSNAAFNVRQAISGWQSDLLFEDMTAVAGTTYFYWVKGATDATGAGATEFSRPDAGWCGDTSATLDNYQVTGVGCTIAMTDDTHMSVAVTSGSAASVKIVRLRRLPSAGSGSTTSTGALAPRASITLSGNAGLDQVTVDGDLARFYTDAPVRELDVAGSLGQLNTRMANVANVSVTGCIGLVRMATTTDGTSGTYATTRIESATASDQPLTITLNGIVLEGLDTAQAVGVLSAASKPFRQAATAADGGRKPYLRRTSLSGIGRVTSTALADSVGEYTIHAASFDTIRIQGSSFSPDLLMADTGTIRQIAVTSSRSTASGGTTGGVIGNECDPTACRLLAPNFGSILGTGGVHATIVAGYDEAQAPDFTGSVEVVATVTGTLSGEVDLSPDAATLLQLLPDAGTMTVVTAP